MPCVLTPLSWNFLPFASTRSAPFTASLPWVASGVFAAANASVSGLTAVTMNTMTIVSRIAVSLRHTPFFLICIYPLFITSYYRYIHHITAVGGLIDEYLFFTRGYNTCYYCHHCNHHIYYKSRKYTAHGKCKPA